MPVDRPALADRLRAARSGARSARYVQGRLRELAALPLGRYLAGHRADVDVRGVARAYARPAAHGPASPPSDRSGRDASAAQAATVGDVATVALRSYGARLVGRGPVAERISGAVPGDTPSAPEADAAECGHRLLPHWCEAVKLLALPLFDFAAFFDLLERDGEGGPSRRTFDPGLSEADLDLVKDVFIRFPRSEVDVALAGLAHGDAVICGRLAAWREAVSSCPGCGDPSMTPMDACMLGGWLASRDARDTLEACLLLVALPVALVYEADAAAGRVGADEAPGRRTVLAGRLARAPYLSACFGSGAGEGAVPVALPDRGTVLSHRLAEAARRASDASN